MTKRLTSVDWLDHGLRVLAREGPQALKADPLAKSLKVSRGSFYWHFRDLGHFQNALLEHWRRRTTEEVMATLDDQVETGERLYELLRRALGDRSALERGIRSWAAHRHDVRKTVAAVDRERVRYVRDLLVQAGLERRQAETRAQFTYWAYVGQTMLDEDGSRLTDRQIRSLATLMTSKPERR